ncbi:Putative uncharacterized protein [Moritella viscosa]|uniref:Uncharacterized protein n=1 Tax=Moritella viscosa TaxID=80854 RepID=A0A090IKD7_9GAMM|nr:putative uncharacterized protein [Moritella viscosa]SGY90847.1 Putative uncharacterized protein [Moritella viscosa]SGY99825.1 Putative uncharacterized protein [Moritella viscosa]SGZ00424.1 Putative uncharacterized protein [Moritella viscosa]SHO06004.1 Putative uncharacterized protein [Moritella viscosa]
MPYKCDELKFYANVVGDRVYILSDKYTYADAIDIQAKVLNCGFKTWLRPVGVAWL